MNAEIIAESERIERERYNKFLSNLGFVHKGKFKVKDHDFALDNYCRVGDCYIMLTLDSTQVLNTQILEYWEIQGVDEADNPFFNDKLLTKTIDALKDSVCHGAIAT